jgi:hypothetical protein
MELVSEYSAVSGFSLARTAGIGMRFDADVGFKPDEGECYIMCMRGDRILMPYFADLGWFTGLWYSPTNTLFFSEISDTVFVWPNFPDGAVASHKLPGTLMGVWGLHDSYVIAWGDRRQATDSVMYRWDGVRWSEMPAPSVNCVISLHGIREDLIYAVGINGYLARWDGQRWQEVPSGTSSVLSSVHVVSDDEMYACGPGGKLLQGSVHGWTELLSGPEMFSVAKWHGEVWIAAKAAGLMKLVNDKLVSVKPNVDALMLDAREDLVISTKTRFVVTSDGAAFSAVGKGFLERNLASKPPAWR